MEKENNLLSIKIISDIVLGELKFNINAPIKGLVNEFILKICDMVLNN